VYRVRSQSRTLDLNLIEVTRILRVAVKCGNTKGNAKGVGMLLSKN